jgi:alpha-galactosidase
MADEEVAMVKIAMMGAGSLQFSRRLTQDIVNHPSLADAHIALMDVDHERLALVKQVMDNMKEQHGLGCSFSATPDRREALAGADFVVCMIMVGGLDAYRADVEVPLKYGVDVCVGDTLNPGGIFRGLRHVPALLEIARDMEELCPHALLLNHANPMAICTWAVQETFPRLRCVGLCHGTQHTTDLLCKWLRVPEEECEVEWAGINHMAWLLKFERAGEDLYPRMWEKLDKEGPIRHERYRFEMMKATRYFCTELPGHTSEYVPYFRHREDLKELFGGPWLMGETAGDLNAQIGMQDFYQQEMSGMAGGEIPVPYKAGERSEEFTAGIMNAAVTGVPFRFMGNVLNYGLITNLPSGCCVEVPVIADSDGFHPTSVGELPVVCAALCRSNISVQELAVQAALNGDYEAAYHACLMDPLTAAVLAPHEIRNLTGEMFAAQMQWLPQFQGKTNSAPGHTVDRLETGATEVRSGDDVYPRTIMFGGE